MRSCIVPKVEARLKRAGVTHVGDAVKRADELANASMPINVQPEHLLDANGKPRVNMLAQLICFFTRNPEAHA